MPFSQEFINYTDAKISVLTDAELNTAYLDIPILTETIHQYFLKQGIKFNDCIALECNNSVLSVLVIIYLLQENLSFLLLPKNSLEQQTLIPQFCHYRITIKDVIVQKLNAVTELENFLEIVKLRDNFSQQGFTSAKVYLRTSGSTGIPKFVIHGRDKLIANATNCMQRLGLQSSDRIAVPVPIFHMYGLGAALLPALIAGASIDLQTKSNLLVYLYREKEFNPNIAFMTPTFSKTLLKGRKNQRLYKFTVIAGDKMREKDFWEFESRFGSVIPLYGSTEMGVIAAANLDDASELRAKTVGKPMPSVQLQIKPTSTLATSSSNLEEQNTGELLCQHACGFIGYADEDGNPVPSPHWFPTGDLGRVLPDNSLEILGRYNFSVVKRDGLLVNLIDIEQAISTIDKIDTVIVVPKGESQRGIGLVAYCIPKPHAIITEAIVQAKCFELLPRRAVPEHISFLANLPSLPNGKIDRQKLIALKD